MLIIALLVEWLCSGLLIRVRKNDVGSNPMECTIGEKVKMLFLTFSVM